MGESPVRTILCKQAVARKRQIADPLARGSENCVAKCGDKGRYSRFSHAGGRRAALRDIDVSLSRHLVDPGDRIVIEVRLLDYAVLGGNLSAAHNTRAENCRAFELRPGCFRIYD